MYQKLIKRFFDIFLSIIFLLFLSPLILLISIFISMDGGPIIFAHERIGLSGRKFKVLKFRTMMLDAESELKNILKDPYLNDEWSKFYKLDNDPRVTYLGKHLRELKLDEIPQFLNVIFGQMSIVGPRPITAEEFNFHFKSEDEIKLYQSVLPGITGAWQINNSLNFRERIAIEIRYIENLSLKNDFYIMFNTILHIICYKIFKKRS